LTISNNVKVIHTFDFEFKASVLNKIIHLFFFFLLFYYYYPQTFVQGGSLGLVTFKWKRVQLFQLLCINVIFSFILESQQNEATLQLQATLIKRKLTQHVMSSW